MLKVNREEWFHGILKIQQNKRNPIGLRGGQESTLGRWHFPAREPEAEKVEGHDADKGPWTETHRCNTSGRGQLLLLKTTSIRSLRDPVSRGVEWGGRERRSWWESPFLANECPLTLGVSSTERRSGTPVAFPGRGKESWALLVAFPPIPPRPLALPLKASLLVSAPPPGHQADTMWRPSAMS